MANKKEIESNEFELLLSEKRHKEMIGVLKSILTNLDKLNQTSTKDILDSILASTSEIPASIKAIVGVILVKLEELKVKEQPSEWVFEVDRSLDGYITTVTAKKK
jgi:hypothetical protein